MTLTIIGCRGLGPMLYQLFPGLLNGHILKEYEVFIAHLIGCANNNAETVRDMLYIGLYQECIIKREVEYPTTL